MTEKPPKPGPDYPGVSMDDMNKFLLLKKLNFSCEICGSNDWILNSLPENKVSGLATQNTDTFALQGLIPTVLLSCDNCGNIKVFRERFIRKFIDEIEKISGVDGEIA